MNKEQISDILNVIQDNFPQEYEQFMRALQKLVDESKNISNKVNEELHEKLNHNDYDSEYMSFAKEIYSIYEEFANFLKELPLPERFIDISELKLSSEPTKVYIKPGELSTTPKINNKPQVDYSDYEVNNLVVHHINEDFTHKRPYGYELTGYSLYLADNWVSLYTHFCKTLCKINSQKFINLKHIVRGDKPYISSNPKHLRKPVYLYSDIYIETNLSALQISKNMHDMLVSYSYRLNDLKIYLRADYTDLHR